MINDKWSAFNWWIYDCKVIVACRKKHLFCKFVCKCLANMSNIYDFNRRKLHTLKAMNAWNRSAIVQKVNLITKHHYDVYLYSRRDDTYTSVCARPSVLCGASGCSGKQNNRLFACIMIIFSARIRQQELFYRAQLGLCLCTDCIRLYNPIEKYENDQCVS